MLAADAAEVPSSFENQPRPRRAGQALGLRPARGSGAAAHGAPGCRAAGPGALRRYHRRGLAGRGGRGGPDLRHPR
eukprot:11169979-Lingulodinium_polyedra.AAC.1